MLLVALAAVIAGCGAYLLGAWPGLRASVDPALPCSVGAKRPSNLLIVGVDDKTLSALQLRWPFTRSLDARAVDVLHADRARTIVYDIQFTQSTAPKEDLASMQRSPAWTASFLPRPKSVRA